jgi:N-acetylmuramate 1-kinase
MAAGRYLPGDTSMTSPTPNESEPVVATISVADESALAGLAARLVAILPRPALVTLSGDLGAGKTTLVKAVAAAAGIDPADVISPTFGLIHTHPLPQASEASGMLLHADMYRLGDAGELAETGWDDAVAAATWAFVEWPERIAAALPADRIDVAITIDAPTARTLSFVGRGRAAAAVASLAGEA